MGQSRRQEREARKRGKQARLAELARRREVKRVETVRASFPKFEAIHVLAVGDGGKIPGFAHQLASADAKRGVSRRIVSVDLFPSDYPLPENLTHVVGNAVEFLKSLPPSSVQRVHDHFTTHHIGQGHYSEQALKATDYLVAEAKAGSKFARSGIKAKINAWKARLKDYFSEVRRVLRPGGKLVLANEVGRTLPYETPIKGAGLRIRFSKSVGKREAARLGLAEAFRWIRGQEKIHVIIAGKRRT